MDEFKKEIVKLVSKKYPISDSMLEIPPDQKLGDFALPCFGLAKEAKKDPKKIAEEIAEEAKESELINEVKAVGPYVNFFVKKEKLSELILPNVVKLKNDYGKSLIGKDKSIMVEFSSPNTNKPQHLGHVRNNLLGMSFSNILEFAGHKVTRVNWINDRGIHICKSMLAYKKWGNDKEPEAKPDHFVGDFYVMFNLKAQDNPELEEEAKEMLRKWEEGDKETLALWRKMNNWVYKGFNETYERLGIRFDNTYYESEVYEKGKKRVIEGVEKGIFKKTDDGAIYAPLQDFNLPDKILMRSDGTSLYIVSDIELAKIRFDEYKMDKLFYIVGSEQIAYFQQLFKIFDLLGYEFANKCIHMSYGMVYLPEGKMKSREGIVVDADDLMDEVVELSREDLKKRYEGLSDAEIEKRSKAIGIGALKFFMLKHDHLKDMNYDPKESISFEGETGPYVQYAYARITSIINKFGKIIDKADFSLLKAEEEKKLVKLIADFPEAVEEGARNQRPEVVARYLLDLSHAFNEFYQACQVLAEDEELKKARILLINCVRQVLKNGLGLLGIECLDEM
jgi:arginyl-tRNA synthetase